MHFPEIIRKDQKSRKSGYPHEPRYCKENYVAHADWGFFPIYVLSLVPQNKIYSADPGSMKTQLPSTYISWELVYRDQRIRDWEKAIWNGIAIGMIILV